MKRPVPVVLSAIFLGFIAAIELLGSVAMVAMAAFALRKELPPTATPVPFGPSSVPILFFGMSVFAAALAVWSILTLIGLVRLRSWARYSFLVIAGCMAGFGGIGALTMFSMPVLMNASEMPTGLDTHAMHTTFYIIGAVYALIATLGTAFLVYFNLASTRALFVAEIPAIAEPPHTSTGRPRPTAITVISWLYLGSAPFCLLYTFLPIPMFFLGFILYGISAHLLYLATAVITFAIGYGLLRLHNAARVAIFALCALCPLQLLVLFTPWGSRQYHTYMDAMNAQLYAGHPAPAGFGTSPGAVAFYMIIATLGIAVVLWFLHRHRIAFTPAPAPPPMPLPMAG